MRKTYVVTFENEEVVKEFDEMLDARGTEYMKYDDSLKAVLYDEAESIISSNYPEDFNEDNVIKCMNRMYEEQGNILNVEYECELIQTVLNRIEE